MSKYIITESQLKKVIYAVLDSRFAGYTEQQFGEVSSAWMEGRLIHIGNEDINYIRYFRSVDNNGLPIGEDRTIVSFSEKFGRKLSKTFKIRLSKVIDIIGDYVEEVHNLPVEEVEIKKSY